MQSFLFYFFSSAAILTAVLVITHPKPSRALISLIGTMFSLAVLYVLLGAPFVAMAHLIVYAGAILVLFLFVIMLQGIAEQDLPLRDRFKIGHVLAAFFLAIIFFTAVTRIVASMQGADLPPPAVFMGSVEAIGARIFSDYLLPFELVSILVIVGILAAVALAKEESHP